MIGPRDIVKAQWEAAQRGALAVWTVYDRPLDHPEGFIARRFEVGAGGITATGDTMVGDLAAIQTAFEKAGLINICRQEGDPPGVVENWV